MQVLVYDWLGTNGSGCGAKAGQNWIRPARRTTCCAEWNPNWSCRTRRWQTRCERVYGRGTEPLGDEASRVRVAVAERPSAIRELELYRAELARLTAAIAVELWAMKSDDGGLEKRLVEYEPRIVRRATSSPNLCWRFPE